MADISSLAGLQPIESIKLSEYKTTKAGFQLPKAGRYTLQAPEAFPPTAFTSTRSGAMASDVSSRIVGPASEGFTLRYQRVSDKVFQRDGGEASQAGDYLRAVGYTGDIPGTHEEIANLVEQYAGAQYEAVLDWEARHGASGFTVKGMKNFPTDPKTGQPQSWVLHPTEKTTNPETGEEEALRVRANIQVTKYLPKAN